MKQQEKLDLILRKLYEHRFDGNYYSILEICQEAGIPVEKYTECRMLAKRLEEDGFINGLFTFDDSMAELTSYGIEYCEEDSYAYRGHSLITNNYLSITDSPNANIVSNSTKVNITINNYGEIKNKIGQIREELSSISHEAKEDLLECLEEVESFIEVGKKPKFSFKQLLEIGSNISGISTLLIELGKLIF